MNADGGREDSPMDTYDEMMFEPPSEEIVALYQRFSEITVELQHKE